MSTSKNKNLKILKKQIMEESIVLIASNLTEFMFSLKEEQQKDAQDCIAGIAETTMEIALCSNSKERESLRLTVEHFKNALENIEGAVAYKAYNRTIKIVGDVIAGISVAIVSAVL